MRILLSWIAFNNDFSEGKVNTEGPNYNFHKYHYNHDLHIILSSAKEDDTKASFLLNTLTKDFPEHSVEIKYMNILDVISLVEIKQKIENLLLEYSENEIDIYFSPGTSIMQVAWYVCHSSLGLKTKLYQTRPKSKSKTKQSELIEIYTEYSSVPMTAMIKEKKSETESISNYVITKSIKSVYDKAFKIAQTDSVTTLIYGESGTGKEHLAKYIHENSSRKNNEYVSINCSAFNDNLLESRLFGHKKGSFTGAVADTNGLFEIAEKGTIFLDEIGDISTYMQQSLLRVLQEKEIMPVGGNTKKINVRVIAATNKNLTQLCKEGKFRWDLYYRLAVASIELPSLLARGNDEKKLLIEFFLKSKKKELKKQNILKFTPEAYSKLLGYSFPGNVRELENIIETLYVFCDEEVGLSDIPINIKNIDSETSLKWFDIERNHIKRVLEIFNGNQRQTFLALGYGSLNTLKKKIKEYNLVN